MGGFYEGKFEVGTSEAKQPFTIEQVGFQPGSVHLTVESQNVRYRFGKLTPSTNDGHLIYSGGSETFTSSIDIQNLKFIAVTGTAIVQYTVKGL